MKALCLSFDWVPKSSHLSLQTMEQKLVQRGETKVDADDCKASKALTSGLLAPGLPIWNWKQISL